MTVATAVTSTASYYTAVYVLSLLRRNIALEAAILVIGVVNGLAGGYFAISFGPELWGVCGLGLTIRS